MKLITGHIFVSFILDHQINMTIVILLYNRAATLSFQTEIDKPYIKTSKAILHQQAEMALSGISGTEICGTQLTSF